MMQGLRRESWYVGDLAGIPIFVHWTAVLLCFSAWRMAPGAGDGVTGFLVVLITLVASIILHELGHGLMARRLGAFGLTITLWAFGGLCESRRDAARLGREIAIVAAGPAVSLALYLGCGALLDWMITNHPAALHEGGKPTVLHLLLDTMTDMNLLLLVFNMMPIFPLDGGQLVYYTLLKVTRQQLLARQISLFLAVFGAIAVFMWLTGFTVALHSGDPLGSWAHMMSNNPIPTLLTAILLFLILRSAFLHLY